MTTYIKRLFLQGFKSFAKPTTIDFNNGLSTIVGPNGAGKCVTGDTLVQLADGSSVRIADLINKKITAKAEKIDDGFIAEGDSTKILALNLETQKIDPRQIKKYVKRKAPSKLLQIRTKSGRIIKTTKYHPLFALKDGKIEALKAEQLKEGLRIAVPRKLNIQPKTKYFFELLDLIKAEDRIYAPWDKKFVDILFKIKKKKTWKELAKELKIPLYAIKGLIDKQAINFAYLVGILRYANLDDEKITSLIPFIKSDKKETYKIPWKNSPEFARFLGYLLAEGRLPPTSSQIWFTNGAAEIIEDYKKLIDSLFDVNSTINEYKANCWDILAYSQPIRVILTKFGIPIGKTENKRITNLFLAHSSDKELSELLNGLYCGDGYISSRSIEITTKSKQLATAIENALLRLGIASRSHLEIKMATNSAFSGIYKTIVIRGVDNFRLFNQNIRLIHKEKQEKVEALLNVKSNPNVDLIEVNPLIKKVAKELKINVKKTRKAFPRLDAYCYNQCTPSTAGVRYLIENLFSRYAASQTSQSLVQLKQLCYSDIFWDEILEIEEIKSKESWVYDLCVEKNHNFVANNIFVHNSNISDAICFVLGRMSSKSLRADRAAGLIYHGGKAARPAAEAKVELILDNTARPFAVNSPEVVIQRVVRRNGFSIYRINGKTKTRQEVLELLAQAGLDPNGFNIILQDQISKFIEMRPEERREIIEEFAGISIYEARKEKSQNELDRAEEKLKEVSAVLNERRAYLRNLDQERSEALKYKKHEETVKRGKATLLHKDLEEKESELKRINEEIEKRSKAAENKKEALKSVQGSVEKLKEEEQSINRHIEEASGIEQEKLHQAVIELREKIAGLAVRKENYEARAKENAQRRQELEKSITEYKVAIAELKKAKPISRSKEGLAQAKRELEELEKRRAHFYKIKQKWSETKNRLEDKKDILSRIKSQSEFTLKQIEAASAQLSEVTDNPEEVRHKLSQLRNQYAQGKKTLEKRRERLVELEKSIAKEEIEIVREQKIKQDVSKLDTCPLCKTKITKEHVRHVVEEANRISTQAETSINKLRDELDKVKNINQRAAQASDRQAELIRKKEHDLRAINSILSQKAHLRKLEDDKNKIIREVKELEKQNKALAQQLAGLRYVEKDYDELRLKVHELSEIGEEDKDAQLGLKTMELERTKNIIRGLLREQETNELSLEDTSKDIKEKQALLEEKEQQDKILQEKYQNFYNKKAGIQDQIAGLEKEQIKVEGRIKQEEDSLNNLKVERARISAEHETIAAEFAQFKGAELLKGSRESIQQQLKRSQEALIRIGSVNMRALEVYAQIKQQYDEVAEKVKKLEEEKQEILNIIIEIDSKKRRTFMRVFRAINSHFSQNFVKLSNKVAFLELENPQNPFDGGIDVVVRVSKGKYLDANSLSGGERTLVAISLIFAIQEHRPYPFYIFDEIDAALDKRNSEKLAGLLKSYVEKGQYIIISHNDAIISDSQILYGVSMQDGVSKILALKV